MGNLKYVGPVFDHCYDSKTEVLTDRGWKKFSLLSYADRLAAYCGGDLVYEHPKTITTVPWDPDKGDLLRFHSEEQGIDLLVTPNHNMYIKQRGSWAIKKANKIFKKSGQYVTGLSNYSKSDYTFDLIGVDTNTGKETRFLVLLGQVLAHGTITTKGDKFYIHLRSEDYLFDSEDIGVCRKQHILSLCDGLFPKAGYEEGYASIEIDGGMGELLTELMPKWHTGDFFTDNELVHYLSKRQLGILFSGYYKISGIDNSIILMHNSHPNRVGFLQELLLKAGYSSESRGYSYRGLGINPDSINIKFFCRDSVYISKDNCSFQRVPYYGHVYCAEVSSHLLVVRRNGCVMVSGNSGYGEASRNYVLAIQNNTEHEVTVRPQCFESRPPEVSNDKGRTTLNSLVNRRIPYDKVIVHLTPDLYPHFIEKGKYNIGMMAWETNRLHPMWVTACNKMNEMWVPCEYNVEALKRSGVTVPVHKVPHGIALDTFDHANRNFFVKGVRPDDFRFYAVFQWSHRKNPDGLLRAYLNQFGRDENVVLIIKTYVSGKMPNERQFLIESINRIKSDIGKKETPRILLVSDFLVTKDMLGMHMYGDCLVSPHRGEGWGLPMFEAGLCGNPVIATGYSGNMEFTKEENSYLVEYQEDFVSNMSSFNSWYLGEQLWAEPNNYHLSEQMRRVFEGQEEAKMRGGKLKEYITENFSWEKIANIIEKKLG